MGPHLTTQGASWTGTVSGSLWKVLAFPRHFQQSGMWLWMETALSWREISGHEYTKSTPQFFNTVSNNSLRCDGFGKSTRHLDGEAHGL